jgi:hypothetical protein
MNSGHVPLVTIIIGVYKMKPNATANRRIDEGQHQSLASVEEGRVVLIEWLNAAVGTKSYQRVGELIRNIRSADTGVLAAHRDGVYIHVGYPGEGIPTEKRHRRQALKKLLRPLDQAFTRYVFHPRLTCVLFGRQRWWFDLVGEPVPGDYKLIRPDGRRVYEADAAFGVFRLASYGFLDRIRQCLTCQKWLYAHPSHKKFCNSACQLKYFASTPMQKEKRAEYMRRYRIDQKQEIERALRLARKPNRK